MKDDDEKENGSSDKNSEKRKRKKKKKTHNTINIKKKKRRIQEVIKEDKAHFICIGMATRQQQHCQHGLQPCAAAASIRHRRRAPQSILARRAAAAHATQLGTPWRRTAAAPAPCVPPLQPPAGSASVPEKTKPGKKNGQEDYGCTSTTGWRPWEKFDRVIRVVRPLVEIFKNIRLKNIRAAAARALSS